MANRQDVPAPTHRDRERFASKIELLPNGCHGWKGGEYGKGYSLFTIDGENYRAHRVIYVWTYGEPNCDIHHTCGDRRCVNPDHLEVAASGQPHHRGSSPNFCAHGHEFTPENTYVNPRGERQCRKCMRAATGRYYDENRDRINEKRRETREHVAYAERPCQHCGRPWTPQRSTGRFCVRQDCITDRARVRDGKAALLSASPV